MSTYTFTVLKIHFIYSFPRLNLSQDPLAASVHIRFLSEILATPQLHQRLPPQLLPLLASTLPTVLSLPYSEISQLPGLNKEILLGSLFTLCGPLLKYTQASQKSESVHIVMVFLLHFPILILVL